MTPGWGLFPKIKLGTKVDPIPSKDGLAKCSCLVPFWGGAPVRVKAFLQGCPDTLAVAMKILCDLRIVQVQVSSLWAVEHNVSTILCFGKCAVGAAF